MCERDELCGNDPENCPDCNPAPNAWRVLDSGGEHRYTVYSPEDADALADAHHGWAVQPVRLERTPQW